MAFAMKMLAAAVLPAVCLRAAQAAPKAPADCDTKGESQGQELPAASTQALRKRNLAESLDWASYSNSLPKSQIYSWCP